MDSSAIAALVIFGLLAALVVLVLAKTVRIVPQARAGIVERFGKYKNTLPAGLNVVTPFVDKVRYMIDLRETVVSFPPQPVITEDNLVVSIDTVIYFQVTNPVAATYEIANYIQAIEQLTMTTLRNIIGGMDLEQALTSRDSINQCSTRRPGRGGSGSTASSSRASTHRRRSRTRWRRPCAPTGTSAPPS
jgi:regulator of protease activity HflC (stomatin/prohibitin superfamily)